MIEATPGQIRAGPGTYAGLFFTTLSTLMYEILLTRIFSVTMWYHFAFVAVSVALFGLTVGALIVYLLPRWFPQDRINDRLALVTLLFSLSIVLSFLTQIAIPFDPRWSIASVYSVVLTYFIISIPFIFSGVSVCLVLTRFPPQVSRLYATDLVGAGLGTITFLWLMNWLADGPSAVLAVSGVAAAGALAFAFSAGRRRLSALAAACGVLLVVLAIGNAASGSDGNAFLRIRWTKGIAETTPLYETWNAFSRIRVSGDPDTASPPFGWGMSPNIPPAMKNEQLQLTIDATAGTVISHFDGNLEDIEYLRYDVTNLAHYVRSPADVFIIGSGGGRDVLSALYFGQPSIKAVEVNGDILDLVNGRFGDFSGHLDQQPGVTFVSDEARSYLTRSDEQFDIIQISLIDTWAASSAGAFALSENSLYTVEAWDVFLDHLTPNGILTVSRWFRPVGPMESHRMVALGAEVLRQQGVEKPRDRMILIRNPYNIYGFAVGTLLISNEAFSIEDIARMLEVVEELDFEIVLAPDPVESDPVFRRIAEAPSIEAARLNFPGDISAPTDDRPFFFQMLRFRDVFDSSLYGGVHNYVTQPVLVLFSLSVAVLGLTALCILLPLAFTTSRKALQGMFPLVVFFGGIGLGYLLLEIAQMQRLIIFLGHPTYALSVVLFSLLVFSGIGSLTTDWFLRPRSNSGLHRSLLLPLVGLLIVVLATGLATPAAIDWGEASTTPIRIATAVAILAPMGLVMGMPFPLGMKVASLRPNAPTAFFWGINGATSACASVLAVAISMGWGISYAFWAGWVSYIAASVALGLVVLRGRV